MAWKALRTLNGYILDLCTSNGVVIENPDAVQDNSPVTFGNTPVSKSSLPASTGELWFNITNNLAINFRFDYVGDSSYDSNTVDSWIYLNSQTNPGYWFGSFGCGGNYPRYVAYLIFIDDENQKACIVWRLHYKYRWGQPGALYDNDSKVRSKSEYDSAIYTEIKSVMVTTSNGGGASHIAKVTGQLSTLSSNLSDILIVSGGGGGGMIIGTTEYDGKEAGGISGSGDNSADQSTGYAFGQGQSSTTASGGGSGLYGGYKGVTDPGVPSAVTTYLNKLASFTAHTSDGRDLSMLYYIDAGPYRNYDLTRPYSATYIWSYDNGSFNFVNGRVYEFMLFDNGRLNLTVDSSTGATTLSFSGFATPSQMPIVYQSNGYNYAYGLGYNSSSLTVSTLGTSVFDGTRYTTSFDSVAACLSYCADHFRNVEVYVNGVAWVTIDDTKYAHLIIPLSGGAGSGYIGNSSLVSYTSQKKMVGYNVPISSVGTTKTESVNTNDVNPEPNTPKINNGHIRIKYIREEVIPSYLSEVGTYLIGREDNKQSLLTCPKWQNRRYFDTGQWILPMSLYHPNTNINSDNISLASFPDGATVSIDTTNGINVTYIGFTATRQFSMYGVMRSRVGLRWESGSSTPKGAYFYGVESGNDSQYEPTKNDFTSLDQLFEYIYNHFRHCNVVLNGTTIVTETSE